MSKLGKEGHKCHFWNYFKLEKHKRGIVSSSSKRKKGEKRGGEGGLHRKLGSLFLERESVFLLSKFLRDSTVGSLRDKKENYSTWRGLRVGTRF